MRCRALARRVGFALLIGVLLAGGNRTATTVWADPGSIGWDVSMDDPPRVCPYKGTANNDNGAIDKDECPDVTSTFQIQGGPGGTQPFFDRANAVWLTGPLGGDQTGDGIPDATDGLVPNRPALVGAKVGQIDLHVQSNLLYKTLLQNNIDDVASMADPHVTGQPLPCAADIDGNTTIDTMFLEDNLELWNAVIDDSNGTVSASETQRLDPTYPSGCDPTGYTLGAACAPKGVTKLPIPIQALGPTLGLPSGSLLVSRSYGIAKMPIVGGIESDMDVNFLVYRVDTGMHGYLGITLVQYPGLRSPDPTAAGYSPLAQTVQTCPPYESSVTVYGVTSTPDFNEDGRPDMNPSLFTPELNRLVVCPGGTCGPYDYTLQVSMAADYDGDTIPGYADRCDTNPSSGSPAQDADGDTLTGTCDVNGEGTNPKFGGWNAQLPWDTGQDVDGDGYLNYVDNCPTVADRDLDGDTVIDYQRDSDGDGVGDVCDPAPTIPGNGEGYASPPPGMFADYDDLCNDPWTVGQPEGTSDSGRQCLKQDGVVTGWNDSNDNGVPDYLVLDGTVMADCNSDSDSDGLVDAVEAAPPSVQPCAPENPSFGTSSDPLDPGSTGGPAVGGIAELPAVAGTAAEEAGTPAEGSGWSAANYAALALGLAAAAAALSACAWYARRRWLR
jgi:hypothetical protein